MVCWDRAPPVMVSVRTAASGRAVVGVKVIGTVTEPPAARASGRVAEGVPTVKSALSELIPVMLTAAELEMVTVWVTDEPTAVVGKEVGETDRGWGTGAPKPNSWPLMLPT